MATAAEVALTGALALPGRHTYKKTFALQYPNGDPVDLTPYDYTGGLEVTFRVDPNGTVIKSIDNAASLNPGESNIKISGLAVNGVIEITIDAADMEIIQNNSYEAGTYDVVGHATGTNQPHDRLMQGAFEVDNGNVVA